MEVTGQHLALYVQRKIKYSFPYTPEGQLAYNIVALALNDAVAHPTKTRHPKDIKSAIAYLLTDLRHTWLAGVDGEWVREVMRDCGLLKVLQNKFAIVY